MDFFQNKLFKLGFSLILVSGVAYLFNMLLIGSNALILHMGNAILSLVGFLLMMIGMNQYKKTKSN